MWDGLRWTQTPDLFFSALILLLGDIMNGAEDAKTMLINAANQHNWTLDRSRLIDDIIEVCAVVSEKNTNETGDYDVGADIAQCIRSLKTNT
jgi:hypothetical protein